MSFMKFDNVPLPGNNLSYSVRDSQPYVGNGGGYGVGRALDAAGQSTGQAFLEAQLEMQDKKLYKPLTNVTWSRDMPVKTGGGFVSYTSNMNVDYATEGGNQYGIVNGQTNNVAIIQANLSKDIYPVFPWANVIKVPLMDQDRMAQTGIGTSLDEIFREGLTLNYNKTLDQLVYFGFPNVGATGLVNDPNITSSLAALNQAGTSRTWANKSPQEIMNDVNNLITVARAAANYDNSALINHILIDPANYSYINNTLISSAGSQSVLSYLMENNIAKAKGGKLVITDARQCIGAGAGATNRMVGYVNSEDKVHFNITVPLYRKMTQPSVMLDAYLTRYESFLGVVKFRYYQCAAYLDGI